MNALEIGMPPTGGIGFGIDRMCNAADQLPSDQRRTAVPDHEDPGRSEKCRKQRSTGLQPAATAAATDLTREDRFLQREDRADL